MATPSVALRYRARAGSTRRSLAARRVDVDRQVSFLICLQKMPANTQLIDEQDDKLLSVAIQLLIRVF